LGHEERTHQFVLDNLDKIRDGILDPNKRNETKGVLSASPFLSLVKFDLIKGFPYDYMHGTLLGVVKRLTTCILDATKDKSYSLSQSGKKKFCF